MRLSHGYRASCVFHLILRFRRLLLLATFVTAVPAMAVPIDLGVMTWNLYFGADTTGIFTVSTPLAIPLAVKTAFGQAKGNDFNLRVQAIADAIEQRKPALIGLQEAANLTSISATNGAVVYSRDFVQILLSALAARGLNYELAVTHTGSSTTLPSGNSPTTIEEFVTLTDRDVILRRSDVAVTNPKQATFVNNVSLTFFGNVFDFNSGYVSVDAVAGGVPFRFVSTHLDPLGTPLQPLQLGEILAATGDAQRMFLVGDFNSAANGSTTPTYFNALAAGFTDVWTEVGSGAGFTCCENANLDNPTPLLDTRLDYILHRGATIDPLAVDLLGVAPFRATAPLYASDHAGLFAEFAISVAEPDSIALIAAAVLAWMYAAWRAYVRRRLEYASRVMTGI